MIINNIGGTSGKAVAKQVILSAVQNIKTTPLVIPIKLPTDNVKGITLRSDMCQAEWARKQPAGQQSYKAGAVDAINMVPSGNSYDATFVCIDTYTDEHAGSASAAGSIDPTNGTLTIDFQNATISSRVPDGYYLVDCSYTLVVWW